MYIHSYISLCLKQHNLRRGDIPSLLGSKNPNKFLRRFDAFLSGNLSDKDIIARCRSCSIFAGREFEQALVHTKQEHISLYKKSLIAAELKAKAEFTPHIWTVHKNSIPSPIFPVALFGINIFKVIDVPKDLIRPLHPEIINNISIYLNEYIEHPPERNVLHTPFGEAIQFLYRYSFDSCLVFDIHKRTFTHSQYFNWKSISQAYLTLKNKSIAFS
ncbi:hypothetical protein LBMAG36_15010 [Chlorobiota bacterium]|nr:hypothetical protein LBMAG36_15010 [Chlorobiota bacterium]